MDHTEGDQPLGESPDIEPRDATSSLSAIERGAMLGVLHAADEAGA